MSVQFLYFETASLTQNASAFKIKRKCVSVKTQVHFTSNARAFFQGWKITRGQAV